VDLTDSYKRVLPPRISDRYELREVRDAAAVIKSTNPSEFKEIVEVLSDFKLTKPDILTPGGGKGPVAKRLDETFRAHGWREGRYDRKIISTLRRMPYRKAGERQAIEEHTEVVSEGYKVDNVKGKIALDVEWNAKDGNLDRDLSAYRALYEVGIITAGVIVTRHYGEIYELALELGRGKPFSTTTTTNIEKLGPRLTRGDSGGCPVLAVAITARCLR
jgi:hypothetical protein